MKEFVFDYDTAFSRNIGWVTAAEQIRLKHARVAIAGLGGVGGIHLLTLARLGVGAFHLAEFDDFDLPNFNRQAGAFMSTLGRPKLDVMLGMAKDINPELEVRSFSSGIDLGNVDRFLEDVDVYVDGLDFFAFKARRLVYARCAALGIPATTAAPLGMGAALMNFLPGRMSFDEYFGLSGDDEQELALRFFVGLAPAVLQRTYLMDPSRVDMRSHRGPSTPMACQLCAGLVGTEVLKLILHRGRVFSAPWVLQYDAYRSRLVKSWRPGGYRNPLLRVAAWIARRKLYG